MRILYFILRLSVESLEAFELRVHLLMSWSCVFIIFENTILRLLLFTMKLSSPISILGEIYRLSHTLLVIYKNLVQILMILRHRLITSKLFSAIASVNSFFYKLLICILSLSSLTLLETLNSWCLDIVGNSILKPTFSPSISISPIIIN